MKHTARSFVVATCCRVRKYPGQTLLELDALIEEQHGPKQRVADAVGEQEKKRKLLDSAKRVLMRQLTNSWITEAEFQREVAHLRRKDAEIESKLVELRKQAADADANDSVRQKMLSAIELYRKKNGKPANICREARRDL